MQYTPLSTPDATSEQSLSAMNRFLATNSGTIPLAVLQRSLSEFLTQKAAAESKLAACKTPDSRFARQYQGEIERASIAADQTRALIHEAIRQPELDAAAKRIGDRPVCRYRVCYPIPTASGRYPEVLDLLERTEVLLQFFADAALQGEPIETGDTYHCYLPDGTRFFVEVL